MGLFGQIEVLQNLNIRVSTALSPTEPTKNLSNRILSPDSRYPALTRKGGGTAPTGIFKFK